MKLHNMPMSPNAIKVWAVIHHLGLEVENVPVDMALRSLHTPEYKLLNPNSKMPTLEDGDFTLWESNAIMQYLANKARDTQLWPTDPRGQADVSRWQCWQLAHWGKALQGYLYEKIVKKMMGRGEPDPKALEEAAAQFHPLATILNAHLEGRNFVATEALTLADYSIASPLFYAAATELPWDDYGNIRAWYSRIDALDSWKKACPTMPASRA